MLISYKWLKQYIDLDIPAEEVAEILTNTGLEVEQIEQDNVKDRIPEGLVVGYVRSTEKHPEADKLSICKVDIGTGEDLQIICGAPNVSTGQKVPVATIGTTLVSKSGEAFKIKKAKLRGVLSEGMICAEDEIGISDDHEGIMVLDNALETGMPFKDTLKTDGDAIIEIAITPNRGDAISYIGVARDLAAVLGKPLKYPETEAFQVEDNALSFSVELDDPVLCPRYSGVVLSGIEVKESPEWLQERLRSIGLNPINNVVDACNYLMFENGQPLHAFDFEEVRQRKLVVKTLEAGTKFKTLDESDIELTGDEIMICDGERGVAMGGVMGGFNSMVTEKTTSILIESAYFNPTSIRKASKKHLLLTDAAYRFERGIDPNFTVTALKRAALLIKEVAGGKISSEIVDAYPNKFEDREIELQFDFVRKVLGNDVKNEEIVDILRSLEYDLVDVSPSSVKVFVPTYRPDVLRPIDLVEEFLRIYSYNAIDFNNKVNANLPHEEKSRKIGLTNGISGYLMANGFFEILSPSFTNSRYLDYDNEHLTPVRTINAVNTNLDTLRSTFVMSGLETVAYNLKRNIYNVRIFEFGRVYFKAGERFLEEEKLGIWVCGKQTEANWYQEDKESDVFYLKSFVTNILKLAGNTAKIKQYEVKENDWAYGVGIKAGKVQIAKVGMIHPELAKRFDIKTEVFYAEIDMAKLMNIKSSEVISYEPPARFPAISRDLALVIEKGQSYEDLKSAILSLNFNILTDISIFDKYEGEKIGKEKKSYAVRLKFQDKEKTLQDKQVDKMMSTIVNKLEKELNAVVRK